MGRHIKVYSFNISYFEIDFTNYCRVLSLSQLLHVSVLGIQGKKIGEMTCLEHGRSTVVTNWKLLPSHTVKKTLIRKHLRKYPRATKKRSQFSVTSQIKAERSQVSCH